MEVLDEWLKQERKVKDTMYLNHQCFYPMMANIKPFYCDVDQINWTTPGIQFILYEIWSVTVVKGFL